MVLMSPWISLAGGLLSIRICRKDLGADHLAKRDAAATVAKLARRIKDLGYEVQYQAAA
jgi:hypothetical protein